MRRAARTMLGRWESLPPRRQVGVAFVVLATILFLVHEMFFPLLQWYDSLLYSLLEGMLFALAVTFATQTELARREREAGDDDQLPPGD